MLLFYFINPLCTILDSFTTMNAFGSISCITFFKCSRLRLFKVINNKLLFESSYDDVVLTTDTPNPSSLILLIFFIVALDVVTSTLIKVLTNLVEINVPITFPAVQPPAYAMAIHILS